MCDNHTRSDHDSSVAECGYHFDLNAWDDIVGNTGEAFSYSDPDSPWSSFAPDTPPGVGIVSSDMPLTPKGSRFGISGDDPGENAQYNFPMRHDEESPTVDPSHLDMGQYQATYDTGVRASDSYINTQACSFPLFSEVGPSDPPQIPQSYSIYPFDQPFQAYQASDIPLAREQDSHQYGSAEVAGAHPPPRYAPSA
ncbi:hypothetical protein SMACR_09300 [Sordaria macrospora]|uniref:WGS project CABT00000000 data, contig 2.77 n=2 Tax=Sordaria macrospora TaxID=5147 RepID=F7WBJ5_SORMK|nr:uncharacterized protein SMAC_09300 [Sordaria macrospora k-hell]KAA8635563.1 hypothetical protein SMACR_09300 [Sordaria macrospora]KAH7629474.1 hypothetical protein B0T09DRAFT_157089 [Sordaria sp. MPI-SDFR-AT-0083]WPJ66308.1 hypothetical protein SMAC4_09300 [Sordaria macrospora]CCC05454.1 unnamed protein product [Sordaria macrospora k-hell]